MQLTTLTFNLTNAAIRHEVLHGKDYMVAPMAMLTVGVHNGSGGPLLYREDDIRKAVAAWNMKPIVVYHPQINGQGVSACDRDVLEAQQVGMVMNAIWDEKLRAEAWIDTERAGVIDDRVVAALEDNRMMEVSTGLFTDNVREPGEWQGVAYDAIATNHQPDHLALLPDQIGACSIADGAGLLQMNEAARAAGVDVTGLMARQMDVLRRVVGNAMSHSNIYSALSRALRERFKPGEKQHVWIADVYDGFVVYEFEGDGKTTLFRLDYTEGEAGVELSTGDPVEVVRVTEYRTPKGEFVGNREARTTEKEFTMDKEQVVEGLIANEETAWGEEDREVLMNMDEAVLAKLAPVENRGKKGKKKGMMIDDEEEEDEAKKKGVKNATDSEPTPTGNTALTTKQYIENAPPEIREVLENGLHAHETEKASLIEKITANKANKFTPEFLGTKGLQELRGLAALASGGAEKAEDNGPSMFYGGAATPAGAPVANEEVEDGGLELPTMNFGETRKEAAPA